MNDERDFDLPKWNQRFDLEEEIEVLKGRFPDNRWANTYTGAVDRWYPHGVRILRPRDLAIFEQVRNSVEWDDSDLVEVSTFVWGRGRPEEPWQTAAGGVPELNEPFDWPTSFTGNKHIFICQLFFGDDGKVNGVDLPGDVLLLFHDPLGIEQDSVSFRWASIDQFANDGDESELFASDENLYVRYYGVRHETSESVSLVNRLTEMQVRHPDKFGLVHGTKIGGSPISTQDSPIPDGFVFIASFGGISARPIRNWPFTNIEEVSFDELETHNYEIRIQDAGLINVFVNASGDTYVAVESY